MKLRRLKSVTSDKIGEKIADFRSQINVLTDEVENLKKQNETLCSFQSLLEGTSDKGEFYLLELIERLKRSKRDRKIEITIQ